MAVRFRSLDGSLVIVVVAMPSYQLARTVVGARNDGAATHSEAIEHLLGALQGAHGGRPEGLSSTVIASSASGQSSVVDRAMVAHGSTKQTGAAA